MSAAAADASMGSKYMPIYLNDKMAIMQIDRGYKSAYRRKVHHIFIKMEYVVDVQGFKMPVDQFVPKDVAVISLNPLITYHPTTFTFRPPCLFRDLPQAYQNINLMMTRKVHALSWAYGYIPYGLVDMTIRDSLNDATIVYVKGAEKKDWLSNILEDSALVVNLEILECPPLRDLRAMFYSEWGYDHDMPEWFSATENARMLRDWLLQI